jgi:peptidylprolyl isomerase
MRKGIKILQETEGAGDIADREKTAIVNIRVFLPGGSELWEFNRNGQLKRISLNRRDVIAGIRYGIEGMRAGGRRLFQISPHLAYGSRGVPGIVSPATVIHCEVELLEVRQDRGMRPEDYSPGRKTQIAQAGNLSRGIPRWQYVIDEDGLCGMTATAPIHGLKWRHARLRHQGAKMEADRATAAFKYVVEFPGRFPEECIQKPYSEGGDSIQGFMLMYAKESGVYEFQFTNATNAFRASI